MCGSCKKKENLKLELPKDVDETIFMEYLSNKNSLSVESIFSYFQRLYNTNYVFNDKQIRRAITNMDNLYYSYKHGNLTFKTVPDAQVESKLEINIDAQLEPKVIRNANGKFGKKLTDV